MAASERDLPPEVERELERLFESCSPPGTSDPLPDLLDEAEAVAALDVDVPTDSARPAGAIAKRGIKAALGWYVGQLAQQQAHFATVTVRALRIVAERAGAAASGTAAARAELRRLAPIRDLSDWGGFVAERMARSPGRVLHADAGDGRLVARLADAGLDVYGVEPAPVLTDRAAAAGVEVRVDDAVTHLHAVPDAALAGIVLSGCVDHEALAVQLELADLAASRLRLGGTLVVLGLLPDRWTGDARVEADLSPGWPLHPETWHHVLSARGLTSVEAHKRPPGSVAATASPDFAVTAVRA